MTQQELDGNKLIGAFMGGEVRWSFKINDLVVFVWDGDLVSDYRVLAHMPPGDSILCEHMEFHKNWNWIIKAAKKCIRSYHDKRTRIFSSLISKDENIKEVFEAVIEFITWYNKCTEDEWIPTPNFPYPHNK